MESIPKYNQFIRKWEVAIVIKYRRDAFRLRFLVTFASFERFHCYNKYTRNATTISLWVSLQFFKRSGKSETPEMTSISNIQTILITIAATAAEAMRWTVEFIYGLAPTSKTVFLDLTM